MTDRFVTTLWAATFVEELHRAGVRDVVLAPGSRSTPLVMAVALHGGFAVHVHLDERSAAFFALGLGKASGLPAAVITTSGTATANLFPAVIEAAQSEAPLLLLTADRPPRFRGSDANQAIDQVRLYGDYPRWQLDLPLPSADAAALGALRDAAIRSVVEAVGVPAGPVHLNFPFEKPLEPEAGDSVADPSSAPARDGSSAGTGASVRPVLRRASTAHRDLLAGLLNASERPLLVAGPEPREREAGATLVETAARLGLPLLADPLSGARAGSPGAPGALVHYDSALRDPSVVAALTPDLIIRLGSAPTSAPLMAALEAWADVHQIVLDPGDRHRDHQRLAKDYLNVDGHGLLGELDTPSRPRDDWAARWAGLEAAAQDVIEAPRPAFTEGWVARECVAATPSDGRLFVSSSMPIRDVDAFGGHVASGARILGNRGASGIDGVVSTALGAGAGTGAGTVALLGDLAFFHDSNGLLAARKVTSPVVFVVVHNDGGGIFHRLPIAGYEPQFTPLFATPHGLDFQYLAALHGLPYEVVEDRAGLATALARGLSRGGVGIIVVPADREVGHRERLKVERSVSEAAQAALGL